MRRSPQCLSSWPILPAAFISIILTIADGRAQALHDSFESARDFGSAAEITEYHAILGGATFQPGEPRSAPGQGSVWAVWRAPAGGFAVIQPGGEASPLDVSVYTGDSVTSLTHLGTRNISGNQPADVLTIPVTAGQRYRIGFTGGTSFVHYVSFRLLWTAAHPATADGREPNDLFSAARDAGNAAEFILSGSTLLAGLEPQEPSDRIGERSVWYHWRAPRSGYLSWTGLDDTDRVNFFTGDSLAALTPLPVPLAGLPTVRVQADQEYRISLRQLTLLRRYDALFSLGSESPAYDRFAGAAILTSPTPPVLELRHCGPEAGEPPVSTNTPLTAWLQWTAPSAGSWRIRASSTDFLNSYSRQQEPPALQVFTGTTLSGLTPLPPHGATPPAVDVGVYTFPAGASVRLRVSGNPAYLRVPANSWDPPANRPGRVTVLMEALPPPPAHDTFSAAAVFSAALDTAVSASLGLAGSEPGESPANHASLWYRWTAPAAGTFDFITSSDPQEAPAVTLWRGAGGLATLTKIQALENLDAGWPDASRKTRFTRAALAAGEQIHLQVHGVDQTGVWPFTLRVTAAPWPRRPEETFAGALPINGQAPLELNIPLTGALNPARHGSPIVYYSWTPDRGPVDVRLTGKTAQTHRLEVLDEFQSPYYSQMPEQEDGKPSARTVIDATGFYLLRLAVTARRTDLAWEPQSPVTLSITPIPRAPHDNLADAWNAGNAPEFSFPLALNGATWEAAEPAGNMSGYTNRSQWVRWTAPSTGVWDLTVPGLPQVQGQIWIPSVTTLFDLKWPLDSSNPNRYGFTAGETVVIRAQTNRLADGGTLTLRPVPEVQRPPNDDLAAATLLPSVWSFDLSQPLLKPTVERFEAGLSGRGSVWHRWIPPGDGVLAASVSAGEVEIYQDGPPPLILLSAARVNELQATEGVLARVTAGTPVLIRAILDESAPAWSLSLRRQEFPSPAGDVLTQSEMLPLAANGAVIERTGTLRGSTMSPPQTGLFVKGGDVWYRFIAPQTGEFWFSVSHTDPEVDLSVPYNYYHLAILTEPGEDEQISPAIVNWSGETIRSVFSGHEYYLHLWAPNAGNATDYVLRCAMLPPATHDEPDSAVPLTTGQWSPVMSFTGATASPIDGRYDGESPSVWYSWTAPSSGDWQISLRAAPREYATACVFTGTPGNFVEQLFLSPPISSANDWLDPVEDHLAGTTHGIVRAQAGTPYLIMASRDRLAGDPRACRLRVRPVTRPANDDFSAAASLGNAPAPVSVSGTIAHATLEAGEPNASSLTVWYRWTPPETGAWTFAFDKPYSPYSVEWFSGSHVAHLTALTATNQPATLAAGQQVWLRVGGNPSLSSNPAFRFSIVKSVAPPRILSAQISPSSVDLRNGPARVQFRMELDTPGGIGFTYLFLFNANGGAGPDSYYPTGFSASRRIAGDNLRGIYLFTLPVNMDTPAGTYVPNFRLTVPGGVNLHEQPDWPGGVPPSLHVTAAPAGPVPLSAQVTSFSFIPPIIPPGFTGPVTVRASVRSHLPVTTGQITFLRDLLGNDVTHMDFSAAAHRISGTPWDGVYEIPFTLPPEGPGAYNFLEVSFYGPPHDPNYPLAGAGGKVLVGKIAGGDFTPPLSLVLHQPVPEVDVTSAPATVKWTVRVLDKETGIARGLLRLHGGSGAFPIDVPMTRTSGTPQDGLWEGSTQIPVNSPATIYSTTELLFADTAGNSRSSFALHTYGGRALMLRVLSSNPPDYFAPVLTHLLVSPGTLTLPGNAQITLRATDDQSGITGGSVTLLDRLGSPLARVSLTEYSLIEGTPRDGTWQITLPVPASPDTVPGTSGALVELTDASGKDSRWFLPADASAGLTLTLPLLQNPLARPWQQWLATQPDLPLFAVHPFSDANGNGIANLLEMALRPGALQPSWTPDGFELRGTLSDLLRTAPDTVRLHAETSSDLQSWPDTFPVTSDAEGNFSVPFPAGSPRHFMRLRATLVK